MTVQELRASPFEPTQSFDSLAGLPNASERACGHENGDSFTCFKAKPTPQGTMLASQTTRGRALPGITMGRADIRLHTVHGRFPSLLNSKRKSRHSASSATSNPAQAARSPSDTSHHVAKHDKKPLRQAALVAARHVSSSAHSPVSQPASAHVKHERASAWQAESNNSDAPQGGERGTARTANVAELTVGDEAGAFRASCRANPRFMSEFTRAQILSLMKQAADAIRHSDEIRRELEVVMKRIEETGYAAQNENRKAKPATGEMGTGRTRTRNPAG